ncbi:MAG: hypothetical protein D6811_10260 [Alphaproteobacteria bacterium]|nr:MAG: hypothetical protein D6811_10260 [Alphaproteobacteria bacterium]
MPSSQQADNPGVIALRAAGEIGRLGTGELAELRRARVLAEIPAYWRVTVRAGVPETEDWQAILRIFSILTPRGAPEERKPLHDKARPWGAVLCDGGDLGWRAEGETPKPRLLSEARLAQLLAARGAMRRTLMIRAARMLAATRNPGDGVNVAQIAWSLIAPDRPEIIARDYYHRLDRPTRTVNEETPANG